jgi:hypothetical protein
MSLEVDQFYSDNDRSEKSVYHPSIAMNKKTAALLLSGLLVACAQTQPPQPSAPPAPSPALAQSPAPAQAPPQAAKSVPVDHVVDILRSSCANLLKLSPQDRDAASMFYIGYQAAHFRAKTINVGLIPSIEDQALTYCVEDPGRTVAQAFAEAYRQTH